MNHDINITAYPKLSLRQVLMLLFRRDRRMTISVFLWPKPDGSVNRRIAYGVRKSYPVGETLCVVGLVPKEEVVVYISDTYDPARVYTPEQEAARIHHLNTPRPCPK